MLRFMLLISLALIAVYTNCTAKGKLEWYEGKIELNNKEVFEGRISYNSTFDVVSVFLDNEEIIKSFTASQVKEFEYFDEEYEIQRKYESLMYQYSTLYRSKLFFEIVLEGGIVLVRRPSDFNQEKEISLLIEKYDLSLKNKENQMILIDYYNFLSDSKRKFETEYVISYN